MRALIAIYLRMLMSSVESSEHRWAWIKNIFEELVLFAHDSAVFAIVGRVASGWTNVVQLHDLHQLLLLKEPHCANINFKRHFPAREKVKDMQTIREVFLVSTRDARVNKNSVRQFILTIRRAGFRCPPLCSLIYGRSTILVIAIFCCFTCTTT